MNDTVDMDAIIAAFNQLREYCEEAWQAIVDALQPFIDFVTQTWGELQRLHLLPRQYRDTMARRKVRRYAVYMRLR